MTQEMEIDDTIRTAKYKGYDLKMTDPYGFVQVSGLVGQFTSWSEAQKAIDAEEARKMTKAQAASENLKRHVSDDAKKNATKAA